MEADRTGIYSNRENVRFRQGQTERERERRRRMTDSWK